VKIEIDQEKCVGAGQCVLAAPDVFDQRDDDGIVELLDEVPPEGQWTASREAAQLCPAAAITIHED
jgi:ferredoxin